MNKEPLVGCLLGTAVGDSLGLPWENLSRTRVKNWGIQPDRHSFFFGHGMVSDDTEHACLTALSFLKARGNPDLFASHLAWNLRWWILSLPGGVGFATLRACLKLWLGCSAFSSGVFSAGNGPAMRAPILGLLCGHDDALLKTIISFSTRITHTDPKAEEGALLIAIAAHIAATKAPAIPPPIELVKMIQARIGEVSPEFWGLITRAAASANRGDTTEAFIHAEGFGEGISGFIWHTVAGVMHVWFRHPTDFKSAMIEIISCGGDADSTAAILGGIMGAAVGAPGLPQNWVDGIIDWPWSVATMERLGASLASQEKDEGPFIFWPLVFIRNLFFLAVVFAHGFRRLFPPL